MYLYLSVHEHIHGDKSKEVGVPSLSAQRGMGELQAFCLHIIHTLARQHSSFEINRSKAENII